MASRANCLDDVVAGLRVSAPEQDELTIPSPENLGLLILRARERVAAVECITQSVMQTGAGKSWLACASGPCGSIPRRAPARIVSFYNMHFIGWQISGPCDNVSL